LQYLGLNWISHIKEIQMKPEQLQPQTDAAENTRELVMAVVTHQHAPKAARERETPTNDPFEAILEAYAKDPERWDGLE
jgi:hypothetical protein